MGLKLIKDNIEYQNQKVKLKNEISFINIGLAYIFKSLGIDSTHITSLFTSIGSGYSYNDINSPLLDRNSDLITTMNDVDIKVFTHIFARPQNNSDEKIFNCLVNNTTELEIASMVIDSRDFKSAMEEEMVERYLSSAKSNYGLRDLVDMPNSIIIYNGCTGSFLDGISRTRGLPRLTGGFERDFEYLDANLKYIASRNINTQVYVCGIPKLSIISPLIEIQKNSRIREICSKYPNVTYVPSAYAKGIYKRDGKIIFDMHHNEKEYLNLIYNIFDSILRNYSIVSFTTHALENLRKSSIDVEHGNDNRQESFDSLCERYKKMLTDEKYLRALSRIKKYYLEEYPYSYYHTDKEETLNLLGKKTK